MKRESDNTTMFALVLVYVGTVLAAFVGGAIVAWWLW